MNNCTKRWIMIIITAGVLFHSLFSQERNEDPDERVHKFLESKRNRWRNMNIPEADGKVLYDLIVKHGYTRALEIGTSTGHSGIWIAWALSKTGGRLITIEIDEERYREALTNFSQAGLLPYIDARLGDAHKLVKELEGPFDFVFCDADKVWYKNYFQAVYPKMEKGGCYTAHNVSMRRSPAMREFLDYVTGLEGVETTINRSSYAGISISYIR
ncbi:MAG TPA: methyltransferase [Bacteroidetes bacterium]|nr:methyltransferase [Bacteroidota bacterium]